MTCRPESPDPAAHTYGACASNVRTHVCCTPLLPLPRPVPTPGLVHTPCSLTLLPLRPPPARLLLVALPASWRVPVLELHAEPERVQAILNPEVSPAQATRSPPAEAS